MLSIWRSCFGNSQLESLVQFEWQSQQRGFESIESMPWTLHQKLECSFMYGSMKGTCMFVRSCWVIKLQAKADVPPRPKAVTRRERCLTPPLEHVRLQLPTVLQPPVYDHSPTQPPPFPSTNYNGERVRFIPHTDALGFPFSPLTRTPTAGVSS